MPTAPQNPNFGTGYVDWGNYVNANQANTSQDRNTVQQYLSGLNTRAGQTPMPYDDSGQTQAGQLAGHQGSSSAQNAAMGGDYNVLNEALQTANQALSTPGGFEQVLAAANAKYDPVNPGNDAQGNPKGPPKAAYDPFTAALEGQNAQGLGPSVINSPANPPSTPGGAPNLGPQGPGNGPPIQRGGYNGPTGTPEGPGGGKPRSYGGNPDNPNWTGYVTPPTPPTQRKPANRGPGNFKPTSYGSP